MSIWSLKVVPNLSFSFGGRFSKRVLSVVLSIVSLDEEMCRDKHNDLVRLREVKTTECSILLIFTKGARYKELLEAVESKAMGDVRCQNFAVNDRE
jgi:hypothetical protein